jgi:geranylgeranylglycerol-phosphate geranylgeranyltransferase
MKPRGLLALVRAGGRFARLALQGRAVLGVPRRDFARAVLRSLRPHYFALPAGACLAGAAGAAHVEQPWRVALAATAAGIGWGVGQLINDLLDVEADAVAAPDRPSVRGLLPEGPTVLVAASLGAVVATMTALVHVQAIWLAVVATCLLVGYGPAKRRPLGGNLAHGALVATAAAIGRLAATPSESLSSAVASATPVCLATGCWAAIYLQSNYEKDRESDLRGACHTLAHVLGLRASAALRLVAGAAVVVATWRMGVVRDGAGTLLLSVPLILLGGSAWIVVSSPVPRRALQSYRLAVHAGTTGMLAMAVPLWGATASCIAMMGSSWLTECAFRSNARSS